MMYRRKQHFSKAAYLKKNQTPKPLSSEEMDDLINQDLQAIIDKNTSLAQEAMGLGDRVLAEQHFQRAEYYTRLMNGGIGH